MAYDNFQTLDFGKMKRDADREKAIVQNALDRLAELVLERQSLNNQCEEVAGLILPSHRGSFSVYSQWTPYEKKTDQQVDATGMVALDRFMAVCDSMLTPKNQLWHILAAGGSNADYLMKDRATRMFFYQLTRQLFRYRYAPISDFVGQNQGVYQSLGAFGNGYLMPERYYDPMNRINAIRYRNLPMGETYVEFNYQGKADGFIRIVRLTARQAFQKTTSGVKWYDVLKDVPMLKQAYDKGSEQKFTFIQRVCPRSDAKMYGIDRRNMPFASYHIHMDSKTLISEGGYRTFPIAVSRYTQAPGEQNGRSPAHAVLPALKTLNAEKKDFLRQGHRANAPVLLLRDDGIMSANITPGAQIRGGWSSDGKPLMGTLPFGDIQVTKEMMDEERGLINDVFLVSLFQVMIEKQNITATQAVEIINEKGILIAPTLSRQEEYLSDVIEREMALFVEMGVMPPMPPLLREARGEYSVVYQSPLSRAARAQEAVGFMRTLEMVNAIANVTQDPSLYDPFDFDVSIPDMAYINGVPEPWMADPQKIAQKRENRDRAQAIKTQIEAAPGAAAIISSQAKARAAGVVS